MMASYAPFTTKQSTATATTSIIFDDRDIIQTTMTLSPGDNTTTASFRRRPLPLPPPPPSTHSDQSSDETIKSFYFPSQQNQKVVPTNDDVYPGVHVKIRVQQQHEEEEEDASAASASSLLLLCRSRNAFVLLAQKKHSTYGRDSYGLLLHTLDLFRRHYLSLKDHAQNTDVFIFHTGDFTDHDLISLEDWLMYGNRTTTTTTTIQNDNNSHSSNKNPLQSPSDRAAPTPTINKGILRLVDLNNTVYWSLPEHLKNDNQAAWKGSEIYPVGYRHMCRWFGQQIWYFFRDLNDYNSKQLQRLQLYQSRKTKSTNVCHKYEYIARLDEDSFLLSPIQYDIFDFMATNKYVYGYRMCAYELEETLPKLWFKKWRKSLLHNNETQRFLDPKLCGFYTNFFVAKLDFFLSPPVVHFLDHELDRKGLFYRKRFGDLLVHTLVVYAFASAARIHRFLDFTYQHTTIDYFKDREKECISWGSIQAGYNDLDEGERKVDEFYKTHVLDKDCFTANRTFLYEEDLSPTYAHLPDEIRRRRQPFKLKTVHAGKVELPHQGILSG